MLFCLRSLLLLLFLGRAASGLQCLNNEGNPVPWWFIYKVNNGYNYAYFQNDSPVGLRVWPHQTLRPGSNSALERTLNQVYANKMGVNYIAYNDGKLDDTWADEHYGDTKGVLAFDALDDFHSGFWLIHSLPKFPDMDASSYQYAPGSIIYAQSFLCMTVSGVGSLEASVKQLLYERPYVMFGNNVPCHFSLPYWERLIARKWLSGQSVQAVITAGGFLMTHFAKSADTAIDIIAYMISHRYQCSFIWETWRREHEQGGFCLPEFPYKELDVNSVVFADGTAFSRTQDHAKLGASWECVAPLVCVGGLNRVTRHLKRGGGYVCFTHKNLWQSFIDAFHDISICPPESTTAIDFLNITMNSTIVDYEQTSEETSEVPSSSHPSVFTHPLFSPLSLLLLCVLSLLY